MTSGPPLRLCLVDDAADIRLLVRLLLEDDERFDVVAEAADGEEALVVIAEHGPDLVLLDVEMPLLGGYEVLDRLRQLTADRRPAVIVFSGREPEAGEPRALAHGAIGFLDKSLEPEELADEIHRLHTDAMGRADSIAL